MDKGYLPSNGSEAWGSENFLLYVNENHTSMIEHGGCPGNIVPCGCLWVPCHINDEDLYCMLSIVSYYKSNVFNSHFEIRRVGHGEGRYETFEV